MSRRIGRSVEGVSRTVPDGYVVVAVFPPAAAVGNRARNFEGLAALPYTDSTCIRPVTNTGRRNITRQRVAHRVAGSAGSIEAGRTASRVCLRLETQSDG